MAFTDKPGTALIVFVRRQPRTTQACRDHMNLDLKLSSCETEELLAELRDEGAIAFANGEWYFIKADRPKRRKPVEKVNAKQTRMFE